MSDPSGISEYASPLVLNESILDSDKRDLFFFFLSERENEIRDKKMEKKVVREGSKLGTFDCSADQRLCTNVSMVSWTRR